MAATTLLVEGDAADSTGPTLSTTTSTYEIDSWNGTDISTKRDRDGSRLRLTRRGRSVVEERGEGGGAASTLADGSADYLARFRAQETAAAQLLALTPETRARLSPRRSGSSGGSR
jgi:hypothetical protein